MYSYGVVLLEILTGLQPSDARIQGAHIVDWVRRELRAANSPGGRRPGRKFEESNGRGGAGDGPGARRGAAVRESGARGAAFHEGRRSFAQGDQDSEPTSTGSR